MTSLKQSADNFRRAIEAFIRAVNAHKPRPDSALDLLDKAAGHMRDRAATYDKPEGERSMGRAVQAFNAITGHDLSEADGWEFLAVLKQVRLFTNTKVVNADSYEDLIAYAALLGECAAQKGLK